MRGSDPVTLGRRRAAVSGRLAGGAPSRALNGRGGVRPDVRERITRLADSLGYRPNRAARNLASGRSSVIGLVDPERRPARRPLRRVDDPRRRPRRDRADQGLMLRARQRRARAHGAPHPPRRPDRRGARQRRRGRRGVGRGAAQRRPADRADRQPPDAHATSTSSTSRTSSRAPGSSSTCSSRAARGIGTVTGPLDRVDADAAARRLPAGARAARRLAVDERLVVDGDFGRISGDRRRWHLVARLRPDGVFAANDEMALGRRSGR